MVRGWVNIDKRFFGMQKRDQEDHLECIFRILSTPKPYTCATDFFFSDDGKKARVARPSAATESSGRESLTSKRLLRCFGRRLGGLRAAEYYSIVPQNQGVDQLHVELWI